ncbi:hypothetical protein ACQ4PT_021067 [Festuca glaucescens]
MAGRSEAEGIAAMVEDPKTMVGDGVSTEPARSEKGKSTSGIAASEAAGSSSKGDQMEDLMARLRLTAAESEAVVLEDEDDLELIDLDRAFVGKVLAPNALHIQTITSAMRPAWGNPKGLVFNPAGVNLFIAKFGSKADRDRVIEGSPWKVGKHAVLMKKYDTEVRPQQVVFDRMAIWARILSLPNRLMNAQRGAEIAKNIGVIKKIESDDRGRCWGGFMRLRVEISVHDPLLRCVTVFSRCFQTTERYEIQYERLPLYCFSCGLLGHSNLVCLTPADRDENGDLPYAARKIAVPETSKNSGSMYSTNVSADMPSSMGPSGGSSVHGGARGRGRGRAVPKDRDDQEVSPPVKSGGRGSRGRGRSGNGRGRGRTDGSGKELFLPKNSEMSAGQKRKAKAQNSNQLTIEAPPEKC